MLLSLCISESLWKRRSPSLSASLRPRAEAEAEMTSVAIGQFSSCQFWLELRGMGETTVTTSSDDEDQDLLLLHRRRRRRRPLFA